MIKQIFKGRDRLNYRMASLLIKMNNSTPYLNCKDNSKAKFLKARPSPSYSKEQSFSITKIKYVN